MNKEFFSVVDSGFFSELTILARVNGISECKEDRNGVKLDRLYRQGQRQQWDMERDICWLDRIDCSQMISPQTQLPLQEFAKWIPDARRDGELFDKFRWELQSWLVCQFLYGEQGALVASSRLVMCLEDQQKKLVAASQVFDEGRHVHVFSTYINRYLDHPYARSNSLESILEGVLTNKKWDVVLLGNQVLVEGLADATFRMGEAVFHDPVIRQIVKLVARDESRHVAFGVILLRQIIADMSDCEKRQRREFVLDAASTIHRCFMLEDIWDRLGVNQKHGIEYAKNSILMIDFRRIAFSKIVSTLNKIGLMDELTQDGLRGMQLIR